MTKKDRLKEIIREKSFREGEFTLASGKKSSYYVDVKQTALDGEGALLIGALLADLIEQYFSDSIAFGGLTLGADPIAVSISMEMFNRNRPHSAFIVRKELKEHGVGNKIEGLNQIPKSSKLLIIEDTVTTGGSALKAVSAVKNAGFEVDGILAVVDRCEGGSDKFKEAGIKKYHSLFQLSELKS